MALRYGEPSLTIFRDSRMYLDEGWLVGWNIFLLTLVPWIDQLLSVAITGIILQVQYITIQIVLL